MNNDLLSLNPLDNPPPEQAPAAPAGSADLMDQALQAEAALSAGDTSAVDTLRQIAESGSDTKAAIQSCQSLFFYYMEQAKDTDRAKYYLDRVRNLGGTYWADLASCCYIHDKAWHDLSDSEGRVAAEVVNGEFGQRMDKATEYLLAVADSPETWLLDTTYDTIFRRGVGDNLCLQDYRRNWGVLFRLAKRISRTPELDMLIREEAAAQAVMILRKAVENQSHSKKDYDLAMKETLTKDEKALLKKIGKYVGQEGSESLLQRIPRLCWIPVAFLCTGYYTLGLGRLDGLWSLAKAPFTCGIILSVLCTFLCMTTKNKGFSFYLLFMGCLYSGMGLLGGMFAVAMVGAFIGDALSVYSLPGGLLVFGILSFCTIRIGLKIGIDFLYK